MNDINENDLSTQEEQLVNQQQRTRELMREELANYERERQARKEERRRIRFEEERNVSNNENATKKNRTSSPERNILKALPFLDKDSTSLKYMLIRSKNFKMWKNLLFTELGMKRMTDIVDSDIEPNLPYSENEMKDRRKIVKGIILSHVDEMYQDQILEINDSNEILSRLERLKREEVNETSSSVLHQLNKIKYDINKETLYDFQLKFDEIVRKYEQITGEKLGENIERNAYYKAIVGSIPTIQTAIYTDKARGNGEGFNLEKMKRYAQQYESEHKLNLQARGRGAGGAMMARNERRPWCSRCGDYGHYRSQCRAPEGYRVCYSCFDVVNHVADNCPNPRKFFKSKKFGGKSPLLRLSLIHISEPTRPY